jgi:hypothetical protein
LKLAESISHVGMLLTHLFLITLFHLVAIIFLYQSLITNHISLYCRFQTDVVFPWISTNWSEPSNR